MIKMDTRRICDLTTVEQATEVLQKVSQEKLLNNSLTNILRPHFRDNSQSVLIYDRTFSLFLSDDPPGKP